MICLLIVAACWYSVLTYSGGISATIVALIVAFGVLLILLVLLFAGQTSAQPVLDHLQTLRQRWVEKSDDSNGR
jgi:hypothetical protein